MPRKKVDTRAEPEWDDWNYVRAYQLGLQGCGEREVADGLGVSTKQLKKWRKQKPKLNKAIIQGRNEREEKLPAVSQSQATPDTLSIQEAEFCRHYSQSFDIGQSALKAGYGGKSKSKLEASKSAWAVLKRPRVQKELLRIFKERQIRNEIKEDEIVRELSLIAFSDMRELFREDGTIRNITDIPRSTLRAIQSIKVRTSQDKDGNIDGVETEFKFWDKIKSLELLAKISGMLQTQKIINKRSQHLHFDNNEWQNVSDEKLLQAKERLDQFLSDVKKEGI